MIKNLRQNIYFTMRDPAKISLVWTSLLFMGVLGPRVQSVELEDLQKHLFNRAAKPTDKNLLSGRSLFGINFGAGIGTRGAGVSAGFGANANVGAGIGVGGFGASARVGTGAHAGIGVGGYGLGLGANVGGGISIGRLRGRTAGVRDELKAGGKRASPKGKISLDDQRPRDVPMDEINEKLISQTENGELSGRGLFGINFGAQAGANLGAGLGLGGLGSSAGLGADANAGLGVSLGGFGASVGLGAGANDGAGIGLGGLGSGLGANVGASIGLGYRPYYPRYKLLRGRTAGLGVGLNGGGGMLSPDGNGYYNPHVNYEPKDAYRGHYGPYSGNEIVIDDSKSALPSESILESDSAGTENESGNTVNQDSGSESGVDNYNNVINTGGNQMNALKGRNAVRSKQKRLERKENEEDDDNSDDLDTNDVPKMSEAMYKFNLEKKVEIILKGKKSKS